MNKKVLCVVAVLMVALFALCACKTPTVLDNYESVKDAKNIVQTITVTNGSTEVAKQTSTFNMASGKVTVEKKVLNDVSAEEQFTTTTETRDFTKSEAVAKLSGLTMSDVVTTDSSFKGTVANADLKTAFGIEVSSVNGGAAVELLAEDGKVVKMTVSYTSSNGNSVVIVSAFTY